MPSDEIGSDWKLAADGPVESAFIGSFPEESQKWLLDNQETALFIEQNIIAIADARTVRDGTILMQWYCERGENTPPYGILPPKPESRWDFRIKVDYAHDVESCLKKVEPNVVYPTYFGRKEELIDGDGVFDPKKARHIIRGT
jgi:hypothetical protein